MTTSNVSNTPVPPPAAPTHLISTSCNLIAALGLLENYLNSTYSLQEADTELQAAISNQETTVVQNFEKWENTKGALYQLMNLDPKDKNYSTEVSKYSAEYGEQSTENQELTKIMDGNNTTAQNTLNQNSQGQQGVVTTMQSVNSVAGNLRNLIQG